MKGHLKTVVGIALSVALLWWALNDVSFAEVAHEIGRADPLLFLLAIAVTMLLFVFRAVRWGILLRPVEPELRFRPRFASIMIGFGANNVLPARVGEFARVAALSRLTRIPVSAALGSLVLERVFDGVMVLALLFAALAVPGFPAAGAGGINFGAVALTAGLVLGALAAVLISLVVAPEWTLRWIERLARVLPARAREALLEGVHSFVQGLAALRSPRLFALSVVWALAQWLAGALSFWLAFRAFGIVEVPFSGAVLLQSVLSLAVAIPSSPGFFGPFEAASVAVLALWEVSRERAISFAIGYHLGGWVPVTLMGFYYVWRLGLRWSEVRHSEEAVEERVEPHASPTPGRV